jgi:hypothetical protein
MLSKHLITIIISIFTVMMIYSTTFVIAAKKEPSCTISEGMATCCWDVECEGGGTEENCINCKQKSNGQWECGSVFTPGLIGTPMCPVKPESGLTVKPSDDSGIPPQIQEFLGSGISDNPTIQPEDDNIPPKSKGLFGLLDENTPSVKPGEESNMGKGKGLLGLLDNTNPTIQQQQSLPETTIPQKDPNDLLSNFEDNLFTNIPKKDSEPSNLPQENDQQESPGTEPDDTDNKNIIKEDSKDDEQDNNNQIYCIRAPCPGSNSNDNQDQLSETPEDEIKSEEDEKEDSNEGKQEQEQ